jgi:hypothetical protein
MLTTREARIARRQATLIQPTREVLVNASDGDTAMQIVQRQIVKWASPWRVLRWVKRDVDLWDGDVHLYATHGASWTYIVTIQKMDA